MDKEDVRGWKFLTNEICVGFRRVGLNRGHLYHQRYKKTTTGKNH
jgi:hypothetical protein